MEIFDSDYSVAEDIIRGLSLDELVHAKNDNPNDTFWGEYIEIKKEQMGLCDLGRSISLDQPEILNEGFGVTRTWGLRGRRTIANNNAQEKKDQEIERRYQRPQYPTLFITPTLSTVSEECLV